jgi:hypothetical protein
MQNSRGPASLRKPRPVQRSMARQALKIENGFHPGSRSAAQPARNVV